MLHCNDIDGLMMDWLYGELDESSAAKVSGHVDACGRCQAEQAAFSRTRDLFRQLPDEEPAQSLTAMLVREAALSASPKPAVAVESAGEGAGFGEWLSRLFRPLMHPAAAALATLVLVAGVAGTLYMKGGDDQFSATRSEKKSADSPAAVATPSPDPAASRPGESFDTTTAKLDNSELGDSEAGAPPPTDRVADLLDARRESELRDGLAAKGEARPRRAEIAGLKQQSQKLGRSKKSKPKKTLETTKSPKTELAKRPASKNRDFESDDDGFASVDDRTRGDGAGPVAGASAAYRGQRLGSDAWAENLQGQLLSAFKKDDCREAARIANDIRERNPSYYQKNTSDLSAVKKCRYYVNSERKRRSARARKAAVKAKSKKSNASSATKNAAPAEDQQDAVEVE